MSIVQLRSGVSGIVSDGGKALTTLHIFGGSSELSVVVCDKYHSTYLLIA